MADDYGRPTGGFIPNREGDSKDDVWIFREPGYIISAAAARRFGLAVLDRLNRKETPDD